MPQENSQPRRRRLQADAHQHDEQKTNLQRRRQHRRKEDQTSDHLLPVGPKLSRASSDRCERFVPHRRKPEHRNHIRHDAQRRRRDCQRQRPVERILAPSAKFRPATRTIRRLTRPHFRQALKQITAWTSRQRRVRQRLVQRMIARMVLSCFGFCHAARRVSAPWPLTIRRRRRC